MDFALTDQQQQIRDEVLKLCARFDDDYWLERDRTATFPDAFFAAMAEGNWLGIAMPEAYGGAGLGITEAAILMQAVAESGACMSGASAIHLNIFGLNPVVVFGTEAQKRRMLPPMIAGRDKACFGVTEPNAGLNTTQITTRAERRGDRYVINGTKIWTSTAQVATKILLLARTTPLDQVKRHSHGLTLFYTTLDRAHAEVRLIHKMGRHAVDFEHGVLRGHGGARGRPHRRGRRGVPHPAARPQPRARAGRRRGDRHRPRRAGARLALCARARRVRPADRPEPGHPASAGEMLGGAGSGQPDGDEGGLALRPGPAVRRAKPMPRSTSPARRASAPASRR